MKIRIETEIDRYRSKYKDPENYTDFFIEKKKNKQNKRQNKIDRIKKKNEKKHEQIRLDRSKVDEIAKEKGLEVSSGFQTCRPIGCLLTPDYSRRAQNISNKFKIKNEKIKQDFDKMLKAGLKK